MAKKDMKDTTGNSPVSQEKEKALEAARMQIEQQFGKGALMKLGAGNTTLNIDVIPSGSIAIDEALGVGGFPKGRIIEIFGPESSGKTTLALHVIAESQKRGGIAAFIDAEHALDPVYAKNLGVNTDELWVSQPDNGEQALEIAESLVRSGAVDVVVVDSVAALVPQAEIAGEMGDSHVGLQARLMSQALRKLTGTISKSGCCLIFINQIRMKIGVMFGNPETTTGGNALKFYASVRIEIRRIETITQGAENAVGNHVRVKVVKNKVAPPFKKVDVDIFFGKGVSAIGSLVDAAVSHGLVVKSGSWYSYGEERIGQGRDNAKEFLEKNPELAAEIDLTIRKKLFPQYFAKPAETAENKAQAGVAAAQAAGLSAGTSGLAAKASLKAKAPAAAATEHEGASDELF